MDVIITGIQAIALIPALAFLYANTSHLIQLIFNKNFDEPALIKKWQLNSYASRSLSVIVMVIFINVIFINSDKLKACTDVALLIGSYWYLWSLINNYFNDNESS